MRRNILSLVLQAAITSVCLLVALQLWRTNLRVPFDYWGDTLFQLSAIKSIADGGWIWFIAKLGAPFGMAIAAFPQNLTTTSVVIKALSVFTAEPGLLLNLYWLLTVVLVSINANIALRVLGFSATSAFALATLYALLPYAFYRNTAHLPLVYPFIPILSAFAVQVASNSAFPMRSRWGKYVIVCAVAQGFDYIYYGFFSAFFLIVAALIALGRYRAWRQARRALFVCGVLVLSVAVNLTPSLIEWSQHGKPPNTTYKNAAEAEILGLKLRQLVSPVQPSRIAAIREYGELERQFPNENENQDSRLGTLVAIGFIGLLASLLFRSRDQTLGDAAARLTLAGILLATVGGFGAIFNLLVLPDIRAYNRIVVFIAFFVIVFMAQALEGRAGVRGLPDAKHPRGFSPGPSWIAVAVIIAFAVLDQGQAARPLIGRYASDAEVMQAERQFVAEVEARFPAGAAIMELPETTFPPDAGKVNMLAYDHARPFLWSSKLSWSWPSFSQRREAWYRLLGSPAEAAFVDRLRLSGFSGIWVDRYGYVPDELAALEATLTARLGKPLVGGLHQRYAFFDFSALHETSAVPAGTPPGTAEERDRLLNPLLLNFGDGFYLEEENAGRVHRWSRRTSSLKIRSDGAVARKAVFRALVQAGEAGNLDVALGGRSVGKFSFTATQSKPIEIPVDVPAHGEAEISFAFDGPRMMVPSDTRALFFVVINPRIDEQ